jgi:hypothetical protein
MIDWSKVHFRLPWREGMKGRGRGREGLTFDEVVK